MLSYHAHRKDPGYPATVQRDFVTWMILSQARPAFIEILQLTGIDDNVDAIEATTSLLMLAALSQHAVRRARANRRRSGKLGMSTAEAAANLMYRMAQVAQRGDCDPHRIAFFSAQTCGWLGFAQSGFSSSHLKEQYEASARQDQETHLSYLIQIHRHEN